MIRNGAQGRIATWLAAIGRAVCARTLLGAILLLVAALDLGSPWIAMAIENNEVCSCCHRKGAACCRRMHHDGPSWQDRSCCGANGAAARVPFSADVPWPGPRDISSAFQPSGNVAALAEIFYRARLQRFSLRQRPPPSRFS